MSEDISLDRIEKMLWEVTGHKIDASQMDAVRIVVMALVAKEAELWKNAPTPLIESYLGTLNTLASQLLDTGGRMRLHPEGQLDAPAPWATRDDIQSLELKVKSLAVAAQGLLDTSVILEAEARIMAKLDELRRPSDIDGIMAALRADPSVLIKRTAAPQPEEDTERELLAAEFPVFEPEPEPKTTAKRNLIPKAGNFFNPDGTITCRICEKPKQPGDYYRDKHAATGYKSACKECEVQMKKKAAA